MAPYTFREGSSIAGNAPQDMKDLYANPLVTMMSLDDDDKIIGFGAKACLQTMIITEMSMVKKAEEPSRDEARVVCRLIVNEDMLNGGVQSMHGGCSATLVDMCTSFAISLHERVQMDVLLPSVSQTISMTYHSPAFLGDELRIVSTTLSVGAKSAVARAEIWNETHKRLVASGVHVKMKPSMAKL